MPTLSPIVPLPQQASTLADIAASLVEFRTQLLQGTLYKQFQRANPGEASRLEIYWTNPSPYPAVATYTGKAIRAAYKAHHQAGG